MVIYESTPAGTPVDPRYDAYTFMQEGTAGGDRVKFEADLHDYRTMVVAGVKALVAGCRVKPELAGEFVGDLLRPDIAAVSVRHRDVFEQVVGGERTGLQNGIRARRTELLHAPGVLTSSIIAEMALLQACGDNHSAGSAFASHNGNVKWVARNGCLAYPPRTVAVGPLMPRAWGNLAELLGERGDDVVDAEALRQEGIHTYSYRYRRQPVSGEWVMSEVSVVGGRIDDNGVFLPIRPIEFKEGTPKPPMP